MIGFSNWVFEYGRETVYTLTFPRVEAREVPVPALDVLGRPRPAQHQQPVRVRLQARPRGVALVHVVDVLNAEKLGLS